MLSGSSKSEMLVIVLSCVFPFLLEPRALTYILSNRKHIKLSLVTNLSINRRRAG
jgi:hypothetical protein